jgi:hypothetical protein
VKNVKKRSKNYPFNKHRRLFVKNLFLLFILIISANSFAQDKILHRNMTQKLNEYILPAQSTSPNKALVYFSNRDFVDKIDYQEVNIQVDLSAGVVQIDLPSSGRNGTLSAAEVATIMTKCQSDAGEVTIQSGRLIIYTDRVPNKVRCESSNGVWRQFYVTMFKS